MIPQIKRILYTTDLSPNSGYLLRYALNSAKNHGAKLIVLHVFEELSPTAKALVMSYLDDDKTEQIAEKEKWPLKGRKGRMKYYPVAVKYFYSEDELADFKKNAGYKKALHPYTFCHYVAASRQRGDVLLSTPEKLGCTNAKYVMGWKGLDDAEIKSHLKYTKDWDQAERFVQTKKQLPEGLLAFATAPLHKAPYRPDVVLGVSDVLQAYHLGNDWCAAHDTHPFAMTMSMNSSICHGCVQCNVLNLPNITPMCSSSKTAGKTEQGEINWIWPGNQLEPTVHWMLERTIRDGGVSFPRTGETYPGFDVCKLCSFLVFRKPKEKRG